MFDAIALRTASANRPGLRCPGSVPRSDAAMPATDSLPLEQIDRIRELARSMLGADAVVLDPPGDHEIGAGPSWLAADLSGRDGFSYGALVALWVGAHSPTEAEAAILADFAALAASATDLWREARKDALTGALSRTAFHDRARQVLSAARRSAEPVSLVMIDLDHFKNVNDSFGHAGGDAVLAAAAAMLQAEVRPSDDFGRLGGEEFVLLLDGTEAERAVDIAERLRERLAGMAVPGYPELRITASFGVAEAGLGADKVDTLLEAADKALYAAKRAGRNCVRLAPRTVRLVA